MESDYNDNYKGDRILNGSEDLKVIGEEHVDIGLSNFIYESSSLLFQGIHIETFAKYVHFNIDSMKLMIGCIQGEFYFIVY